MTLTLNNHIRSQILCLLLYFEDGNQCTTCRAKRFDTKILCAQLRDGIETQTERVIRDILDFIDGIGIFVLCETGVSLT